MGLKEELFFILITLLYLFRYRQPKNRDFKELEIVATSSISA